jgi:hypothetical protein
VSDATRSSSVLLEAQRSKSIGESVDMQAVPRTPGAEPGTVKSFLKLFQGAGKAPCPQFNVKATSKAKESETAPLGRSWKSEVSTQSGEAAINKSVLDRYATNADTKQSPPPSWVKPSQEHQ